VLATAQESVFRESSLRYVFKTDTTNTILIAAGGII
jgi:hypothetical protein